MDKTQLTNLLKEEAHRLGFGYCGVSKSRFLAEEEPRFTQWLKDQKHGQMGYMERNFDKRLDPGLLVEGARSVISVIYNYYPQQWQPADTGYKLSCYAYGKDYHTVVKDKLYLLLEWLKGQTSQDISARVFVDSAPVMDKQWARLSGAGWIGKHTNLIRKRAGSFFFIGEIVCDVELDYDGPVKDLCGTCTKCIDACPTEAIVAPYVLDATRCISYLTIELRDEIPQEFKSKMDGWVFGCDVCQQVCPWNRFSTPTLEADFAPAAGLLDLKKEDWEALDEDQYKALAGHTPITRARFEGFKRNISFVGSDFSNSVNP